MAVPRKDFDSFVTRKVLALACPTALRTTNSEGEGVTSDTLLSTLLLDSLDMVELIMDVEQEYGVSIPDGLTERHDIRFADISLGSIIEELKNHVEVAPD